MRISDWSSDVCSSDLNDMAGAGEGAQSLDRRHQFHAVVGGIAFAAGQFLFMLAITDDCSPTATARIALAGPIGENLYCGELAAHAPSNALALAEIGNAHV